MKNSLIAVDWGSTNLRAKLIVDGEVKESRVSGQGIKNVEGRAFEQVLVSMCGQWKEERLDLRVLLSGMVGSREGWTEVPYCQTTVGIGELASRLVPVQSQSLGEVFIVPGLRHDFADGTTDVMRGEETEVFGVLAELTKSTRLVESADGADSEGDVVTVCGPGTHSKWVNCRQGEIVSFRTWFTGEAFERLTQDSLISGSGGGSDPSIVTGACERIDETAFVRGLEHSGRAGGLLHHLFLGRTDMLTKRVEAKYLPTLISGILIGHEIREARLFAEGAIQLVGNNRSAELYRRAFVFFGLPYSRWEQDVHLAGMLALQVAQS